jgi:hypothetical protein
MSASHERTPAEDDVRAGSERSFGIDFAVVAAQGTIHAGATDCPTDL